ncbi:alpha/beta hydrolase domain-containing protein 11 [Quillaja saponaria]|uniref:Alpha/beta hydrolase domain-containing protein 11 n=1 Tax=Quillaja saponaria TaxID=32244 RepID=A0AAD7VD78_QUISA|nr:alpha/beta hydrolase domain-containing protein 11 [Quillaja saponaria]
MAAALRNRNSFQLVTQILTSSSLPLYLGSTTIRRSLETIAYEEVRAHPDKPYTSTAFIIHGFLGSGRNWRSFSRNLIASLSNSSPSSNWRMVLVDMRNHGKSAERNFDPPHDMVNTAKDMADLVKGQGWSWPEVVIGHSMGGKVAMQFADSCSRGDYGDSAALPKQVWVLDSIPGEVNAENSHEETREVLQTLQSLPLQIPSRKWLVNHLVGLGFSKSLSEWIGTNLKKAGDHETWAFDLDGAGQMLNSYWEKSYWTLLENPPKGVEIQVVRAENSDRWDSDTIQRIENFASRGENESLGKVSCNVLSKSGHWVHADNPEGLLEIMVPNLASL